MKTFANIFDVLVQIFSCLRNLDNFETVNSLDDIFRDLRQNFSNRRLEETIVSVTVVGANSLMGANFHRTQGTLNWRVALVFGWVGMLTAFLASVVKAAVVLTLVRIFAVAPLPDDSQRYELKMIVALKPLRDASGMDKTAFDDLENVIVHGALQNLLVLPGKYWSDRELAAYHAKQYLSKITERRARANLGAGRASMSVQMRPFV